MLGSGGMNKRGVLEAAERDVTPPPTRQKEQGMTSRRTFLALSLLPGAPADAAYGRLDGRWMLAHRRVLKREGKEKTREGIRRSRHWRANRVASHKYTLNHRSNQGVWYPLISILTIMKMLTHTKL